MSADTTEARLGGQIGWYDKRARRSQNWYK
jgi:hypothetical protein